MKVLVSACIMGVNCKYNGKNNENIAAINFLKDKEVISIKMTLYRVAKHSKIVEYLIDAAENGKEVLVLVLLYLESYF